MLFEILWIFWFFDYFSHFIPNFTNSLVHSVQIFFVIVKVVYILCCEVFILVLLLLRSFLSMRVLHYSYKLTNRSCQQCTPSPTIIFLYCCIHCSVHLPLHIWGHPIVSFSAIIIVFAVEICVISGFRCCFSATQVTKANSLGYLYVKSPIRCLSHSDINRASNAQRK